MVTLESKGSQVELILDILSSNVIPSKFGLIASREILFTDHFQELVLIGSLELGDVGMGTHPLQTRQHSPIWPDLPLKCRPEKWQEQCSWLIMLAEKDLVE